MTEEKPTLETLLHTMKVGDQAMLRVEKAGEPVRHLVLQITENPDGSRRWKVLGE